MKANSQQPGASSAPRRGGHKAPPTPPELSGVAEWASVYVVTSHDGKLPPWELVPPRIMSTASAPDWLPVILSWVRPKSGRVLRSLAP